MIKKIDPLEKKNMTVKTINHFQINESPLYIFITLGLLPESCPESEYLVLNVCYGVSVEAMYFYVEQNLKNPLKIQLR